MKTRGLRTFLWEWNIFQDGSTLLKFVFSEKATKFEKNLRCTSDKSVEFCARNSILVKKLTKIFKNKCGQIVLFKVKQFTKEIETFVKIDPILVLPWLFQIDCRHVEFLLSIHLDQFCTYFSMDVLWKKNICNLKHPVKT